MTQVSEDIIEGACCAMCHQYFEHPQKDEDGESIGIYSHGYPVVCEECYDEDSTYAKATEKIFSYE